MQFDSLDTGMVVLRKKWNVMFLMCHMQQLPIVRFVVIEPYLVEVEMYLNKIGLGMVDVVKYQLTIGHSSCLEIYLDSVGLRNCMVIYINVIGHCMLVFLNAIGLCMLNILNKIGLGFQIYLNKIGLAFQIYLNVIGLCTENYILDKIYVVQQRCAIFMVFIKKVVLMVECKGMELWVSHLCRHLGKLLEEVAAEKLNYLYCRMVHRLWSLEIGFVFVGQS